MKYACINGWTKESMITHIKKEFRGKSVCDDRCVYRASQGRKCAVGMFIPDEKYQLQMDGLATSVAGVVLNYGLSDVMPLSVEGLSSLQIAHDSAPEAICLNSILEWVEDNVEDAV